MIELQDVVFKYKKSNKILDGINFTFKDGEAYVIQGNNGTGKTTLLRLLCGLLKVESGKIKMHENSVLSLLPDNNGIYENMTILENIKFRISIYDLNFSELEEELNKLLILYDLDIYKEKMVNELSLGMKKKVALICTLIVNPDILILDEPTVGIDNNSKAELITILNTNKNSNLITIITSHDLDFIEKINAHRVHLANGVLEYECNL